MDTHILLNEEPPINAAALACCNAQRAMVALVGIAALSFTTWCEGQVPGGPERGKPQPPPSANLSAQPQPTAPVPLPPVPPPFTRPTFVDVFKAAPEGSNDSTINTNLNPSVASQFAHPAPRPNGLEAVIYETEKKLADPSLDSFQRQSFERLVAMQRDHLAAQKQSEALWNSLLQAKISKDRKKISEAETELANYLNERLMKITGKGYPAGRTLEAVLKDYKQATEAKSRTPISRQKIAATIVITLLLVPLGIYLFRRLRPASHEAV